MLLRLDDARETKQGVEFRLAAAEGNEIVDRVTARAALENFLQVARPVSGLRTPSSSKALKQSAERTSAHL